METNTHRCNKMQHTRQEQLSNPVNENRKKGYIMPQFTIKMGD
jgi:hypothetical protein